MADQDKELGLKITTSADVKGAEQAEAALKRVGSSAEDYSEQMGNAAKKVAGDGKFLGSVGEAAAAAAKGTEEAGDAASTTAKQFTALKQSGDDVRKVFTGIGAAGEGGTRGIVGMLNAGRGLVGIFQRIGSVLAGPVGLGLGAAAAGIAYLGRIASQNQKAIEKVFADAAARSDGLKGSVTALQVAAEKSLKAQQEEVAELTKEYEALTRAIDQAGQRSKALNDARTSNVNARFDRDEQAALGRARTPEEREKITRDFAAKRDQFKQQRDVDGLTETELNARNRSEVADRQIGNIRAQRERAEADVAAAKRASDDATGRARDIADGGGVGSSAHTSALEQAKAAAAALKLAEENSKKIRGDTEGGLQKASDESTQAKALLELVAIQREGVKLQQEAVALARQNAAKPKMQALAAKAQAAMESGDTDTQDKAVKELQEKQRELKRVPPALVEATKEAVTTAREVGDLVISSINGVSTAQKKTKLQLLNQREQSQ